MWRDPLDELIEDLEQVAPDARQVCGGIYPFVKLQALTDAILYGSDDDVARLKTDPDYQRWIRHVAEMRRGPNGERFSASSLASLDRTVRTGDDH